MGRSFVWAVMGGVFCMSLAAACSDGSVVRSEPTFGGNAPIGGLGQGGDGSGQAASGNEGGAGSVPKGQGVGQGCSEDRPCRDGLMCNARKWRQT